MRPDAPVERGDLVTGLLSAGPQVPVRFVHVVREPPRGIAHRAPEGLAEVARFDAGDMLDQA